MSKLLATLFMFTVLLHAFQAKSANTDLMDDYLESMFSGRYKDTKIILEKLNSTSKNNIQTRLAFANFWMLMYETSGENEKYHTLCKQDADFVINSISSKQEHSNDEVFQLISAKSIKLKILMDQKNYLKAVKDIRDIIAYFEYALDHEDNYKMKLIAGMYNYYIETAKEDYPIIYPIAIFYPSGDKQKGIKMIKDCTKVNDKSIRIRSYLYLARIYYRDEKNIQTSAYYYNTLLKQYPDNIVWRYEYLKALEQFNKKEEALIQKEILSEKINNSTHLTMEQRKFFSEN